MKTNQKYLIVLGTIVLAGVILSFSLLKKEEKKIEMNVEPTKNEENQNEKGEKQVCIEGLSWNFRGVDYTMKGWENHELAGKTRKLCCGLSKEYDGTFYKACVYDEEYILWVSAPYTNNEFRKETVGYRKNGQFCKVSYDYYQPGEKIESEDCYSNE